jgi:hypothetical protein
MSTESGAVSLRTLRGRLAAAAKPSAWRPAWSRAAARRAVRATIVMPGLFALFYNFWGSRFTPRQFRERLSTDLINVLALLANGAPTACRRPHPTTSSQPHHDPRRIANRARQIVLTP